MQTLPSHCSHRPPCPGCPRLGEAGCAPDALAQLQALADEAQLPLSPAVDGPPQAFRYRARLAVHGRARSPKIGIFQQDSHKIVDIPRCLIHHPRINEVVASLKSAIFRTQTPPYHEGPHRGLLRYVQITIESQSQRAQVVLIGNCEDHTPLAPLADTLQDLLGEKLHSLWFHRNTARTNAILGDTWHLYTGPPAISESFLGADIFFPPGAFGQNNIPLATQIAEQIAAWIAPAQRIVEFYAGCGALSLGLLKDAQVLTCNELAPASLEGLRMGLAAQDPQLQDKLQLVEGPAGEHAALVQHADIVLADPPRKGLDAPLLDALCATPPERFIYLSCGLSAFLRDARHLLAQSPLRLQQLIPYALFPYTQHVETLALFTTS